MSDTNLDLWWEARQRTANENKPSLANRLLTKTVAMSLAGAPTRISMATATLGRANSGIVIDLNKYRPGRNLQQYVDAGVDGFKLRMGGPRQWVMNNWQYEEDATYRPYMEQIDKLGMLDRVTGYIVHNPFELWSTDYNTHVDLVNQWTGGGYMPANLCVDHEVAQCWQNNVKIPASGHNLVGSLAKVTDLLAKRFGKMVEIYTARWFTNQWFPVEHTTYLDNINRPELGIQRPLWMAWYPQDWPKQYDNWQQVLEELLVPSGSQLASLLQLGNHSSALLWQFSDRVKLPGDTQGVDANVTMQSFDAYCKAIGWKQTVPAPEPDPEPPTNTEYVTRAEFDALKAAFEAHTHGKPL